MATWSAEELLLGNPEPQEARPGAPTAEELVAPLPLAATPAAILVEELLESGSSGDAAVGRDRYPVSVRALNTGLQGD
jgi:hypothetical protein